MCNEYQLSLPIAEVVATFEAIGAPVTFPSGRPNLGPMASIRIGDRAPVVRSGVAGPELGLMSWAWKSPQGRPVFNFRSEERSFGESDRCLIPADGFFEFTAAEPGQKRKTRWRFTLAGAPLFWIAGVIHDDAFAMLTTAPGADIASYHDRQIVVLRPEDGAAWLHLQRSEGDLLKPLPGGSLAVEKVFPA